MKRKSYSLDCLTKVEGHARLDVEMSGKEVKKAEISVFEPSRYFEHMVLGKSFDEVPSISQRICGICSVVHTVTSIKAVESATGISPSRQTVDLRNLLLYASTMHSHTAHLFFFAAPDYLGLKDAIELSRKKREVMELAIELQRISSGIVKDIGGRSLHPVNCRVGGFNSVPDRRGIESAAEGFKGLKELSSKAAEMFMGFEYPRLSNPTLRASLKDGKEYPLYEGKISATGTEPFHAADYAKRIKEETVGNSTAKLSRLDGMAYMTGALARMENNHERLSADAGKLLSKSRLKLPCDSVFMNNVAQAIEMVHFSDAALALLEGYQKSGMRKEPIPAVPAAGEGVAACEAPRGTLYHHYRFNASGKCTKANIITPTCQNVACMESDIRALLPSLSRLPDEKVERRLEMLIRAYDPCFSCSTHFLNLKLRR